MPNYRNIRSRFKSQRDRQIYLRATAENQSSDVNSDGLINHRDAHAVVAFLNARSSGTPEGELGGTSTNDGLDANGDGHISP